MQQFSLVYNNLFVFLEPEDEPRPTYAHGQYIQGSSSIPLMKTCSNVRDAVAASVQGRHVDQGATDLG